MPPYTKEELRAAVQAEKTKRAMAAAAKAYLRETPAYRAAKADGEGRNWIRAEAASFAESAFALLNERMGELNE
jgi:hypothetical protein